MGKNQPGANGTRVGQHKMETLHDEFEFDDFTIEMRICLLGYPIPIFDCEVTH